MATYMELDDHHTDYARHVGAKTRLTLTWRLLVYEHNEDVFGHNLVYKM